MKLRQNQRKLIGKEFVQYVLDYTHLTETLHERILLLNIWPGSVSWEEQRLSYYTFGWLPLKYYHVISKPIHCDGLLHHQFISGEWDVKVAIWRCYAIPENHLCWGSLNSYF